MEKQMQSCDVQVISTFDIIETDKPRNEDWPIREQRFYTLVVSKKHNFIARIKDLIYDAK